jgi:hypothetical protein
MSSTEQYKAKQKSKALGMLKELYLRIQRDEFEVTLADFWMAGTYSKYIFRVDVEETKNPDVFE